MTIGAAISNALSGLGANARAARTVSSNVSNAMTPGYGVRDVPLSSSRFGGVDVGTTQRLADPRVIADRRSAEATLGVSTLRSSVLSRVAAQIGEAGEAGSLSDRVAALGAALTEAAGTPENEVRLTTAVNRAKSLAEGLRNASDTVQAERTAADAAISDAVDTLNGALEQIDDLNSRIVSADATGGDVSAYLDQRQTAIDEVSRLVPVREIPRKGGAVMLVSQGGQILLDAEPTKVSFENSPVVTADMAMEGERHGLTVGKRTIGDMTRPGGPMSGGKLSELFSLRDETLPDVQEKLDGFAMDLVDRFSQKDGTGTVKTLSNGREISLFTDPTTNAPANKTGLAGRIETFSGADGDLDLSDDPWRLRDGLDAATEDKRNSGNAARLTDFLNALDNRTVAASASLGSQRRGAGDQADAVQSAVGSMLYEAERSDAQNRAAFEAIREEELGKGVDTDAEMQKLLQIEQSYGANARVIEVANSLLQRILEI